MVLHFQLTFAASRQSFTPDLLVRLGFLPSWTSPSSWDIVHSYLEYREIQDKHKDEEDVALRGGAWETSSETTD